MEAKRDYYDVLGVNRQADQAAIKKAYRKLAKKYHPDTNEGRQGDAKKFQEITEAYSVLGDPEKRKLYDRFGHAANESYEAGNNPFGAENIRRRRGSTRGSRTYRYEGDAEDFFHDIFGDIFSGKESSQNGKSTWGYGSGFPERGADLKADVTVSFEEAAFGCDKTISLTDPENGQSQTLQVHIPAGIDSGKSVRLRGKGLAGYAGGAAGDLLLKVAVQKKEGYERKGADVYTTAFIPYTTAVFGGEARVHTLHGDVMCKIKAGTQSGSKIRLRGKGIVSMKNPAVHGDQYVTVQIDVPKNLSEPARQKLMEYKNAG